MDNNCIYINFKDKKRCCKEIINSSKYCKDHLRRPRYIFEIMSMSSKKHENIGIYEMYEFFIHSKNNFEDFKKVINYLLDKNTLIEILKKYGDFEKKTKKELIEFTYELSQKTHIIANDDNKRRKIVRCQRLWKKNKIFKNINNFTNEIPENTEDPFTFDSIEDIPKELKYGYKDMKGHLYVFNVVELEYFIRKNGCWNPYTKEKINDDDIYKMYLFIRKNKLKPKKDELIWESPIHALTDMSYAMEKQGFYNNVEWLKKLTLTKCKKTIKIYRDLTNDKEFFSCFEINEENYIFEFCKEVIRLFKNADKHYLLCCNFTKALALNISEYYDNLPSWLLSIPSQSNYLNTTGLLYYYIQDILSDIQSNSNDIVEIEAIQLNYVI